MRHYEIVAMVHPDQHERAGAMAERWRKIVADSGGAVHRFEDWGRRALAYRIGDLTRARYFLMNVECEAKALSELEEAFRYNEAVIRSLFIRRDNAVTEISPIMKKLRAQQEAVEAVE